MPPSPLEESLPAPSSSRRSLATGAAWKRRVSSACAFPGASRRRHARVGTGTSCRPRIALNPANPVAGRREALAGPDRPRHRLAAAIVVPPGAATGAETLSALRRRWRCSCRKGANRGPKGAGLPHRAEEIQLLDRPCRLVGWTSTWSGPLVSVRQSRLPEDRVAENISRPHLLAAAALAADPHRGDGVGRDFLAGEARGAAVTATAG